MKDDLLLVLVVLGGIGGVVVSIVVKLDRIIALLEQLAHV